MQGAAPPPFQASYVSHRGAVLRLLVGMVGPQEAEDCFSETFLKALRAWPPAERDRVEAWLLSIAHRTALDALRRGGREVVTADVPAVPVEDDLPALDATALWDAVRRLAPKQRGAVVLRTVLDMSHAQVAAVLGCSEAASRRSYADGIAALRGMEEVAR